MANVTRCTGEIKSRIAMAKAALNNITDIGCKAFIERQNGTFKA